MTTESFCSDISKETKLTRLKKFHREESEKKKRQTRVRILKSLYTIDIVPYYLMIVEISSYFLKVFKYVTVLCKK